MISEPEGSFAALGFLFGLILFLTGILQLLRLTRKRTQAGRSWHLMPGIIDVLLGCILMGHIATSMTILRIVLGVWFVFRGFSLFSFARHINHSWLVYAGGIMVSVFGLLVLFNPAFGDMTIILFTAPAFIVAGVFNIYLGYLVKMVWTHLFINDTDGRQGFTFWALLFRRNIIFILSAERPVFLLELCIKLLFFQKVLIHIISKSLNIIRMKKILILSLFILISGIAFAQQPLYRYYNPKQNKHYYTTRFDEYGNGTRDWAFEGVTCRVFTTPNPQAGIKELFRYYNPKTGDHFYTMKLHELGMGDAGYNFEGASCFIYKFHVPGTVPLLRYYNGANNDHFYTTDKRELGPGFEGYNFEQVAGFVYRK